MDTEWSKRLVVARGGRVGSLAALGLGAIALAVGLGMGLRWLWTAPLAWQSVLGGMSLVAGILLVTVGAVGVGPTAAATGPGRGRCSHPCRCRDGGLDAAPALMATVVAPTVHGPVTPGDLGLGGSEVRFDTDDGVTLWA